MPGAKSRGFSTKEHLLHTGTEVVRSYNRSGRRSTGPRRLSGLLNVSTPETAAELYEFLNCLTSHRRGFLKEAHKRSGNRTKLSIQKYAVTSLGWGEVHTKAFESLQDQLRTAVKLAHRDPAMDLCIFTDASDRHWAGVATQCRPGEVEKDAVDQRHEPLAFLSGEFTGPELAWTTYEK